LDDRKRTIVAGILRPGATQPELREVPNDVPHIRRCSSGSSARGLRLAVSLTVLSLNIVADRFRDLLDSSLGV